jgi:predicted anti-sigma-YlaC factor YlaD
MMSCHEVRRSVERFLALELEPEREREVRDHLAACPSCLAAVTEREPSAAISLGLGHDSEVSDEVFVAEVFGGIHQRRVEVALRGRRWRWLATVAAVLAVAGGTVVVRRHQEPTAPPEVAAAQTATARSGSAFVEVEGEGVRVYQVVPAAQSAVQVAFIVDPKLEL